MTLSDLSSTTILWRAIRGGSESTPLIEVERGGSGWLITSFLLINTALGIGLLNFPAAYAQAGGILSATLIQILMMALMISTMLILAHCSDVNGDKTYHDVLRSVCGPRGQQLAALSISVTLYCVCVASLIVIGDQLDVLFRGVMDKELYESRWWLHRGSTIPFVSICFILPLCFFERVDFLGHVGSLGIFAMLYPVFLTVYGYFKMGPSPIPLDSKPTNLSAMFAMFPVLGLGYQCQEVVVPVYSCMRERTLWNFVRSSLLAMAVLFVAYSLCGCFGYLTFGPAVAHNVMIMYNPADPFVLVGSLALAVKMAATYPILGICGRDALCGLYAQWCSGSWKGSEKSRRYVFAALWFSSSLILAIVTDGIGVVIKYLGSVASLNIFFYPGICLMQVVLKNDPELKETKSKILVAYAILVSAVGAFCFGVVLTEAIVEK